MIQKKWPFLLYVLFMILVSFSHALSADLYVSPSGNGDGSIISPTDLQSALDIAKTNGSDDIIYLAQGSYDAGTSGANTFTYDTINNDNMTVELQGGWNSDYSVQSFDPFLTLLDGGGTAPVLNILADQTGVGFNFSLTRLTIQNGKAATEGGAGIRVYTGIEGANGSINLTIKNCRVRNNDATTTYNGGGLESNCYFEIYDTEFTGNTARSGGALMINNIPGADNSVTPIIDKCTFDRNTTIGGWQGSAVLNLTAVKISRSTITGCAGSGSPIYSHTDAFLTLSDSIIYKNQVDWWGSALSLYQAGALITNCLFYDNQAGISNGYGAISYYSGTNRLDNITILNSVFTGNQSMGTGFAAIHNRGANATISNSIFWNNEGTSGIYNQSGTASISHSIVHQNVFGGFTDVGNNLNDDPLFVDISGLSNIWDLHLTDTSPAIDSGDNDASNLPADDLDGRSRIFDGNGDETDIVDMGAYEFNSVLFHEVTPLVTGNGTIEPDTAQSVPDGYTLNFTLTPAENHHLVDVTGTCGGTLIDNNYTTGTIATDCTVMANFSTDTYALTYAVAVNGILTGETSQFVNHGENGTAVTVVPDDGFHFTGWDDGITDNPRIDINVIVDISVSAIIEEDIPIIIPQGVQKIIADDGESSDNFGTKVAVKGSIMVISAPGDDWFSNYTDSGSIYIFKKDENGQWILVKKISSPVQKSWYRFGESISIFGDMIAIAGSYPSASVHIFQKDAGGIDNWGIVKEITGGNGDDNFGHSASLYGDTLVVSAYGDDSNGSLAGAAYIFQKDQGGASNWGLLKKITPLEENSYARFGYNLSIFNDTIVVGAYTDTGRVSNSGAAYIFQQDQGGVNNWGQVKKIYAADGEENDQFSLSVASYQDMVIFGARFNDVNGIASGAAYIFHKDQGGIDNWGQVKKLIPFDGKAYDIFGNSVAVVNDMVAVGASHDQDIEGLLSTGAAYLYKKDQGGLDNWGMVQKISAFDGQPEDSFGYSVAIDSETVVAGAFYDDDNGLGSGSAYIFPMPNPTAVISMNISMTSIPEDGGTATITLNLSSASEHEVTAYLEFSGTAEPDDYVLSSETITIPAGELSGNVEVTALDNDISDPDKRIQVDLINVTHAHETIHQQITISIADNEIAPSTNDSLTTLLPANGIENDNYLFGLPVAVSGGIVAVGAPGFYENTIYPGAVYLFQNKGISGEWEQIKKITSSDGAAGDLFGNSIAMNGELLLIGASSDDDNGNRSGSVYLFGKNMGGPDNWGLIKKILAADGVEYDDFGKSVAVTGDILFAGATGTDTSGSNAGAVYVFYKNQGGSNNWGQVTKLTAFDGELGDQFGSNLAVFENILAVTALYDDDLALNAGAVYIFDKNTDGLDSWGFVQKITAYDGTENFHFGGSVSIFGEAMAIGVTEGFSGNGSVYMYQKDLASPLLWEVEQKLTAFDGQPRDNFGVSVSLFGSTLVVGASQGGDMGGLGMAYVFQKGKVWNVSQKLMAPIRTIGDYMGSKTAIENDIIVLGARQKAFIFTPLPRDTNGDGIIDMTDVFNVLQILKGMESSTTTSADTNGDKKIGAADAVSILQGILSQGISAPD